MTDNRKYEKPTTYPAVAIEVKRIPPTLYCGCCGSKDVAIEFWVRPNEHQVGSAISYSATHDGCDAAYNDGDTCYCGVCSDRVNLFTLEELWKRLGDIEVNAEDEIEEEFLNFPAGTSKFDVWRWFDERCPNSLHDDLLYLKDNDSMGKEKEVRMCDHCGKPMKEGYYLGGEYACSDECCLALYKGDKEQMDEDLSHAEENDAECYWTEWESIYFE